MPRLITPIILSGGSGTRLWPLSVPDRPKQFIPLLSEKTMFAETLARVSDSTKFATPVIVGAERHNKLIAAETCTGKIIQEPCPRGTAPAIALAALEAGADDTLLLVLSSDHAIQNTQAFLEGIDVASQAATDGWLVCLGIEPTHPETGYGYIELADEEVSPFVRKVQRFVEKPALETAQKYIKSGNHVWNAGIFLFRADQILNALSTYDPELYQHCVDAWKNAQRQDNKICPDPTSFEAIKSGAVDTVVMERAHNVACAPVDMGWSDVGSWDALYELSTKDGDGNSITGEAVTLQCTNLLLRSDTLPIAAYGLSDLIIVATVDGMVILPRGQSQHVKMLADLLNQPKKN